MLNAEKSRLKTAISQHNDEGFIALLLGCRILDLKYFYDLEFRLQ